MNWVDVVVIVVAALAALRGWQHGLLRQIFELGGGFIGLLVGIAAGPRVADAFTDQAGIEGALISLFVVFLAVTVGQTIGFLSGHRLSRTARAGGLEGVDSALGSGFGVAVWLVSFWLIGSLLVNGPSRPLAKALQRSALLDATNDVLPEPPNLLAYLGQYLQTSGFPQVFVGIPRVSEPVDLPSQQTANRAGRNGSPSTVRLVVEACGGLQLGSGWVVDGDSVVTNAHVVAGGSAVTVQEISGGQLTGRVVLFDPDVDVAIVQVPGLTAPPLRLETVVQEPGTGGASIGYPGNRDGEQVVKRAAVQASFEATGRDIYGRSTVTREVYELRSPVRQGDSGGPFVLPDGRVAGVVFAASTTDGSIGYALTGREVEGQVSRGAERTEPTGTGSCTR
jgi:uncharacterized membrane protein required for colicin V production